MTKKKPSHGISVVRASYKKIRKKCGVLHMIGQTPLRLALVKSNRGPEHEPANITVA